MYTIWPEMSLVPPEVNRKLARNSPEYVNGIHLGRNEFEYFTASSRDRFSMNYFFGVSTFSTNWYFEKLSLLSYGLKFEYSKFDWLLSVTWFGFGFHWSRDRGVRQRVSWLQKELFTERAAHLHCNMGLSVYQMKPVLTGLYRFRQNWPRNFPDLRTKVERLFVQVVTWLVSLFTVTWLVNSNFAPPSIATPHDFAVPSYPRDCFVSGSIQLHQT